MKIPAALLLTIVATAGCQSHDHDAARVPGDTHSTTAGQSDGAGPVHGPGNNAGNGGNGDQLPMEGLH